MDQKFKTRSVIVKQFGDCDSLLIEDFDLDPLADNIRVKVEFGALNFADLYTRKGFMPDKKLPFVLGIECTGTITQLGDTKNSSFKVGQRVICYDFNGGMYREILHIHPNNCFILPDSIDTKLGASIFVNYLTAYFSIINIGNLRENESVLILSCTGGVGSAAVQISKMINGVKVFGTGSRLKQVYAKENGVDTFFCNKTFSDDVKNCKFDLILSNESGPMFTFLQGLLKPLGRIVVIGANNMLQPNQMTETSMTDHNNVSLISLVVNNRIVAGLHLGTLLATYPEKVRNTLEHIFNLIEQKKLNPVIHSLWKMSDIAEATKLMEERKTIGKVLINVRE